MKLAIVGYHAPVREGTPTGRVLHALGEGLVAEGHEVRAWSWTPTPPLGEVADWCEWRPLPPESRLRMRGRALVRPRHDVVRAGWRPPDDFVALADEPLSWGAVARAERSAVTFHYLTRFDAPAVRRPTPHDWQDLRHERHVARRAPVVLAFSERVGAIASGRARTVPIACHVPREPLPLVEEPTALLLANWEWPPNAAALTSMLRDWPGVRTRVPSAKLLLAGWGLEHMGVGPVPGIVQLGAVRHASDALAQASVLAFPCPSSSGPKVKVLEALAHGVPVVTTEHGAEGLRLRDGEGVVVAAEHEFADVLADVLADPERRAQLSIRGREAIEREHSPRAAARARVRALEEAFA